MHVPHVNFDWIADPAIDWTENMQAVPGSHEGEDGQPRPPQGHWFQLTLAEFAQKSGVPFTQSTALDEWTRGQPFQYAVLPSPNGVIVYRTSKS